MYERPTADSYYLGIAEAVALRSNCIRRQVGAIIVVDSRIVSTGYNGTPSGMANCFDGGCERCNSKAEQGSGYNACICVHAEQNSIFLAARHGTRVDGGTLYCTLRPCGTCLKSAIQSGISRIVYAQDWTDEQMKHQGSKDYYLLADRFLRGVNGNK